MHAKSQVSLIRAEDGRCRSSHAHQHVVITPIALGAAPRADVVADGSMICGPVERLRGLAKYIWGGLLKRRQGCSYIRHARQSGIILGFTTL